MEKTKWNFWPTQYLSQDEIILEQGGFPIQSDWYAYKRITYEEANVYAERMPREDKGRDEGDVSTG